jgi:hypothetical protein
MSEYENELLEEQTNIIDENTRDMNRGIIGIQATTISILMNDNYFQNAKFTKVCFGIATGFTAFIVYKLYNVYKSGDIAKKNVDARLIQLGSKAT